MSLATSDPFLTIGLTTCNRHDLVSSSVQSLIDQSYDNYEIIIVDDSPAFPVPVHIVDYWLSYGNVRYFLNPVNRGLAASRNAIIHYAKGKYFSFCDDDDIWPLDFACRMVESLQNYYFIPKVVLAFDYNWIAQKNSLDKLYSLNDFILFGYTPPVGSQMYELELVRNCCGYNEKVKSGIDHDLWISLSQLIHV